MKTNMLKDIIEEANKKLDKAGFSSHILNVGSDVVSLNSAEIILEETAQLVAREVLREERKRITSVLEKAEPSIYDPDGNNSYDRSLKLEGYKDCFAEVWSAINPLLKYAIGIDFGKSDPHLQTLEEELGTNN
jgi:phosphopantetheinyl transferase (holo-ACP synthase)